MKLISTGPSSEAWSKQELPSLIVSLKLGNTLQVHSPRQVAFFSYSLTHGYCSLCNPRRNLPLPHTVPSPGPVPSSHSVLSFSILGPPSVSHHCCNMQHTLHPNCSSSVATNVVYNLSLLRESKAGRAAEEITPKCSARDGGYETSTFHYFCSMTVRSRNWASQL